MASLESGNWRNFPDFESTPQVPVVTITRIPQVLLWHWSTDAVFGVTMDPCIAGDKTELIRCLDKIHEQGAVHNDFPRSNVMRNRDGRLVVIDSGLVEKRSPYIVVEGGAVCLRG